MIVTEDLKKVGRRPDFVVLTGNGVWELRVLKGLERKFSCDLILFFPKSRLIQKTSKRVYEAIRVYVSKYNFCRFLVLYDNEHHKSFSEDIRILNELGVRVLYCEQIVADRILFIFGKLGSHGVVIYTSVQGFRRSGECRGINEEIVELIRSRFGVSVNEDHGAIRQFLRSQNMDITELVESSGVRYLKQAITLYLTLEELSQGKGLLW